MIWSGLQIYWANDVYQIQIGHQTLFHFFPQSFYHLLHLEHHLAQGLAWHFFLQWIFIINGMAYVICKWVTGDWFGIYSGAQRFAYTVILLCGVLSVLTGLEMYKPVQLQWIGKLLGGYECCRWIHFALCLIYPAFFLIHVIQVARAGWGTLRAMIHGYEYRP
jgi:thiosulfate reductase cytochrome b subunit